MKNEPAEKVDVAAINPVRTFRDRPSALNIV